MASPDPVQLSDRVYYLPGGVNCALVTDGAGGALLIDTGQDKTYGRSLRKACETLNVTPLAIVNTHSHADHYGGNDYLLRHFDVPVYAPPFEAQIMQAPYLEPVYLFSGAKPLSELMSKWLLAKPSTVDNTLEPGTLTLHGVTLEILETSGHAHAHLSVLVDGVLVAADALFGAAVLAKYPLPFGQDIGKQIESAERLLGSEVRVTLPGHGDPTEDLAALVKLNLEAFETAARHVEAACDGGGTESVLRQTCLSLGTNMSDLPRYYLNLCVVTAYLSYLREEGRVRLELRDNRVHWTRL